MMVEVSGDMLKSSKPVGSLIVVPVNTVGVAGKGLACWMRMRFPEAYEAYAKACRRGKMDVGEMLVYDAVIYKLAMFPTKFYWGNVSDLGLIRRSAMRLLEYMWDHDIDVVHAPPVGCGNRTGMLDWETDVKPIIDSVFHPGCGKEIVVYSR